MPVSFGEVKGGKVSVSIIMATIDNRAELLEHSLWTYVKQTYSPIEVIVVADRPKSAKTKEVVESYRGRLDVKYFEISGPPGWRNGYGQNKGIAESTGDILILTHPETMFEFDAVEAIVAKLNNRDMVCVMLMWAWLTEAATNWIRNHDDWKENVHVLRELMVGPLNAGFVKHDEWALNVAEMSLDDSQTMWQSAAMTRKTWLDIGGFTLMNSKSSMDRDFQKRKQVLHIPTPIAKSFSYHQYHPWGPVNNPLEVFAYGKPEDAIRELKWE